MPTVAVIALAVAGLAAWTGVHFLRRRAASLWGRALFLVFRLAIATAAFWLVLNVVQRLGLALETSWRLWLCSLIGAGCVEAIVTLYRLERRTVRASVGFAILVFRLLAVVLIILMLVMPVLRSSVSHKEERFVAVLVDDSASMDFTDEHATVSEKLALAEIFSADAPSRPFRVDRASAALRTVGRELGEQTGWLNLVEESGQEKQAGASKPWQKRMTKAASDAARLSVKLAEDAAKFVAQAKPAAGLVATLKTIETKLTNEVAEPAKKAAALSAALNEKNFASQCASIKALVGGAMKALDDAIASLDALGPAVDEAVFASLSAEQKKVVAEAAAKPRSAVARQILLKGRGDKLSILTVLGRKYTVRFYRFASEATETGVAKWQEEGKGANALPADTRKVTDLAAALERVRKDVTGGRLAGVLVVSDGRHNAKKPVEALGVWLGEQGVAACSVLVGSSKSPNDAAVVGLTMPRTTQVKDKLAIKAEIRVDGMKGKEAEVVLTLAGKQIDSKKIRVPGNAFRTTVELTDHPKEPGFRAYEIKILPLGGERVETNNIRLAHVDVTDDPTKLLLIEGRPRWEFRYLRNLFADRDRSVKLQHVLLRPDWIAGAAPREVIHASTARGPREVEASALPKTENDWLQFDTIILGDVPPSQFGKKELKILEKFVSERPRRLIVIAGANYMPHAFADTPLRDMLPVTFAPSSKTIPAGPELSFHITLTEAGKRHTATELDQNEAANEAIWQSLPEIFWRHPIKSAKPGANVLAFAMPMDVPAIFLPDATHPGGAEELARDREAFERSHAVITTANYALGRVMLVGFDSTWRFRYRKGDTHHHKFWGQVLRWATADKLSAGNEFVRLGTDRRIYEHDESVIVRASLQDKKHVPVVSDGVSVAVYVGKTFKTRTKLQASAGAGGLYEADLGELPAGHTYRIALEVKDPAHPETVANARGVETEVVVAAAGRAEVTELSADRTILEKLAQLSDGEVAHPADAGALVNRFGIGTHPVKKESKLVLWNHEILFLVIALLVTAEWLTRKKVGLT